MNDTLSHTEFDKIEADLKHTIEEKGFVQEDKRMNRMTQTLPGHFIIIEQAVLNQLREQPVLDKYKDDSRRMYSSFRRAMSEAKTDPNSRRLMVFNDSKYDKIYQCFTTFQFVYTHRNEFDMYVYQRSADLAKFKDDLTFFAHQMKKFEKGTAQPVTKLVVVYGSVHYEIK
jgi:hypothetical protein